MIGTYIPGGLAAYFPRRKDTVPVLLPDPGIYTGDCRELGKQIPDNSIDCIFTDPPYIREYMYLYGWLAEWAARVLKPDGFVMCYVGNFWKDDTMAMMRPHLEYFWDFTSIEKGNSPVMWNRRVINRVKSILCYRKKGSKALPRVNVLSAWQGSGEDKRFHTWGQDESTARYYVDCFSRRGDLVVDPFVGGGTTAYVCKQLGRPFIGFEIDPRQSEIAVKRLESVQAVLSFYEVDSGQLTLDSQL